MRWRNSLIEVYWPTLRLDKENNDLKMKLTELDEQLTAGNNNHTASVKEQENKLRIEIWLNLLIETFTYTYRKMDIKTLYTAINIYFILRILFIFWLNRVCL